MEPTKQQSKIRDNTNYIRGSTHYHKRKADGKYEVVASLHNTTKDDLGLSIGGTVVLDVQDTRPAALEAVRFFRNHKE